MAAHAEAVLASPALGPPARLLVVDDLPANVKLLVDLLRLQGHLVESASDGRQALDLIARHDFDLLLLDVVMPGMDGYQVCRQVRRDPARATLPVVMITALDNKDERIKGLDAGADDFLSKPINAPELLARVRSLLRIKRLHDETRRQAALLRELNLTLEARVQDGVAQLERLARLKRFFSPQLADLIIAGGADDPLTSHRREIVVVYLDLRGFTAFAETSEPEEVMRTLSHYHQAMGRLVMEYGGTLERFTGDGMMIFFGDPLPVEDPAIRGVSLALEMQRAAAELAARWARRGIELGLAIGVAQGFATLGAIGFDGRLDYGAIGTVTNLACRLCQEAAAGEVLISQRVRAATEERVSVEDRGEHPLRGFARPVRIYRATRLS